jgi:hypothetical protein
LSEAILQQVIRKMRKVFCRPAGQAYVTHIRTNDTLITCCNALHEYHTGSVKTIADQFIANDEEMT